MPVTLRCAATGDLLLLSALAKDLLGLIGKNAAEPGILEPKDMPLALTVLRALKDAPPPAAPEGDQPEATPAFSDEAVSLHKRAWPLIQMIEQALAGDKPIVWGV